MYGLAPCLFNRAEFNPAPTAFGMEADFFFKFNLSARQEVFSRSCLAFWDRPSAVILAGEERTAGMRKQKFQLVAPAPEHQQTSANAASRRLRFFRHHFAPLTRSS